MIEEYAASVYSALINDFDDVEYEHFSGYGENRKSLGMKKRRPYSSDLEIYSFPQTWSSTALGFGGVGGQAFTTALTVVVLCGREACVYFGGRLAYHINRTNNQFYEDLKAFQMHDVAGAKGKYEYGI